MNNKMPLDAIMYKARQVSSLYSVILELADKECSCELLDLISIASDLNDEMWQALKNSMEEGL